MMRAWVSGSCANPWKPKRTARFLKVKAALGAKLPGFAVTIEECSKPRLVDAGDKTNQYLRE